jgi:ABC-type branched-subunit amino acid transport system ATPase component
MLKVKNLTKKFGGVVAVRDCNFEIEQGKITGLIGPNGSGKTTVFNLISGIIKPDNGDIILLNKNITGNSVDKISNFGISRMFQQSRLFKNLTVRENLLLAIDNEDQKFWKNICGLNEVTNEKENRITEILEKVGMGAVKNKLTEELSYGQKRLVELARTILNPHALLMLDEPIAGVNPKIRADIAKFLLMLKNKGTTILLIEHDMPFTLGICDNIIVMDAGSVIARGSPSEIRENKLVLEAYLGYNKK